MFKGKAKYFALLLVGLVFQLKVSAAPPATYQTDQSGQDVPAQFGHPEQTVPLLPADQNFNRVQLTQQQQEVIALQKAHARRAEVTVTAPVYEILPDEVERLQHERFLLKLTNGSTILVAHDISYAPRVPVQVGAVIRIHGEYIWNPRGGIIHWTHLSDSPWHESGWIDYAGKRYQ